MLILSSLKPDNIDAQCPHPFVVGSNVGVPTLTDAVNTFGWIISANVLENYSFCIDGTFTFNYTPFTTLTVLNAVIILEDNANIVFSSNSQTTGYILDNCAIQGSLNNNITFQGGSQTITNSSFNTIESVVTNGGQQTIDNNCIMNSTSFFI